MIQLSRKTSILIIGLAFIAILRIPAFFFGPDTDTGILAASSLMINHGLKLYTQIWDNKTPGMYYMFAFIFRFTGAYFPVLAVFGILNFAGLSLLIYHLTKKLFDETTGLYAFIFFILTAAYPVYSLDGLDTEYFVLLWIVLSSVLLFQGYMTNNAKYFFLSGLALGLGFAFKQLAFLNIIAVGLFALSKTIQFTTSPYIKFKNIIHLLLLITGVVVVQVIWMTPFVRHNNFQDMWYAVYEYNAHSYIGQTNIFSIAFDGKTMFWIFRAICGVWPIWLSACTVFLVMLRKTANDERFLFINLMFITSLLAICSSGRFFGHYFLQAIPWAAIYAAYSLVAISRCYKTRKDDSRYTGLLKLGGYTLVISFICLYSAVWGFYLNKYAIDNPYYRTKHMAKFLREKMHADDTLYIWGNPVSIYLLTKKIPLTKYTFIPSPLTEPDPGIETMKTLEARPPTFIVKSSVRSHIKGMQIFLNTHYKLVYQYKVRRFNINSDNHVQIYKVNRSDRERAEKRVQTPTQTARAGVSLLFSHLPPVSVPILPTQTCNPDLNRAIPRERLHLPEPSNNKMKFEPSPL